MAEVSGGWQSPWLEVGPNAPRRVRRLDSIGQWGAALEHGDEDEVERIMRQTRAARVADADGGRLGWMVGTSPPAEPTIGIQ